MKPDTKSLCLYRSPTELMIVVAIERSLRSVERDCAAEIDIRRQPRPSHTFSQRKPVCVSIDRLNEIVSQMQEVLLIANHGLLPLVTLLESSGPSLEPGTVLGLNNYVALFNVVFANEKRSNWCRY